MRRRFYESANNLVLVKDYFDEIYLLDNSHAHFNLQYALVNGNNLSQVELLEAWVGELINKLLD